jgi:hypothetical protein
MFFEVEKATPNPTILGSVEMHLRLGKSILTRNEAGPKKVKVLP